MQKTIVVIVLFFLAGAVVAGGDIFGENTKDILNALQGGGFTSWAVVVFVMGAKLIKEAAKIVISIDKTAQELSFISEKLERHVTQTEVRLAVLEQTIGRRTDLIKQENRIHNGLTAS